MHQRSSVGDGRFIPTSSDVTNQWPGLVSRRCWPCAVPPVLTSKNEKAYHGGRGKKGGNGHDLVARMLWF
ncbi:hypothetical protein TNCV_4008631 [Trichonephila clavipes]|nr:hypothetical protein TNCV_4008631 [Trichonephila clavipes]